MAEQRGQKRQPPNLGDVYAAVSRDLLPQVGDAAAEQAGVPLSVPVEPATASDRVKAWNTPHPQATDEAMQALAEQKYAEHRGSGMNDAKARAATAEDLTHFRYRARMPLYTLGTTSVAEQVKEAERLARAAGNAGGEDLDALPPPEPVAAPEAALPAALGMAETGPPGGPVQPPAAPAPTAASPMSAEPGPNGGASHGY